MPEQVTETVNPWFVQLPFTNTSSQTSSDGIHYDSSAAHDEDGVTDSMDDQGTDANVEGGEQWLYDMVCYPKDQTGNPTLDKSVRNAYSNTIPPVRILPEQIRTGPSMPEQIMYPQIIQRPLWYITMIPMGKQG